MENWRLRKVVIYFYLNDGTIYVCEPKVENSGIPQGVFMKQQRIPKTNGKGDWYTWRDFNIGINMKFYDHVFRIVNCDLFTRKFLTAEGIKLNGEEVM